MNEFLSGNEAAARGVYEAGVALAAAYPGTPSTEILETIAVRYPSVYSQWSPNEKVAKNAGLDVKKSEVHGMLQRYGAITLETVGVDA